MDERMDLNIKKIIDVITDAEKSCVDYEWDCSVCPFEKDGWCDLGVFGINIRYNYRESLKEDD